MMRVTCLGGHDVSRHPDTIYLDLDGDRLVDAYGEPVVVERGGQIRGWEDLDSQHTYRLQPAGAPWHVTVPARTLVRKLLAACVREAREQGYQGTAAEYEHTAADLDWITDILGERPDAAVWKDEGLAWVGGAHTADRASTGARS
jgi:hypothetical protein